MDELILETFDGLTLNELLKEGDYVERIASELTLEYADWWGRLQDGLGDNMYVIEVPAGEDNSVVRSQQVKKLCFQIYTYLKSTNDVYNKQVELLKDPTLGSTKKVTRFNDTPQNGGDWSKDTYTSTINTTEDTATFSTVEQLALLRRLDYDYVKEFCRKFEIYGVE